MVQSTKHSYCTMVFLVQGTADDVQFPKNMVQPTKSFRCTMVYLVHDLSDRGKFLKNMVQMATSASCTMLSVSSSRTAAGDFTKIHGTAGQMLPLYHAHRLSAPRHDLEIALEPWYRWTFSLSIPCSRGSRHSLSQEFVKKAWYRETLFSPVPCPPAFHLRNPSHPAASDRLLLCFKIFSYTACKFLSPLNLLLCFLL